MKANFSRSLPTTFLLGIVLFLISSCATTIRIHPSGSEEHIRHQVLEYTPIGSSYAQVQEFIQSRLEKLGPAHYRDAPARRPSAAGYESVGVRCILVMVAEGGLAREGTFVTWAFDQNDNLLDVIVNKELNSE